jgi:hypothetical protein
VRASRTAARWGQTCSSALTGAHSVVRPALFGPSPTRYRGYTTVGALTPAGSVPLPRDGSETWGCGIRFGVAPTSGERVIWYAVWKAPAGEAGVSTEHLLRLFGSWQSRSARSLKQPLLT